jgi:hypothetical protein
MTAEQTVYILGENHASSKTGRILRSILPKEKIDAILAEGFDLKKFYTVKNIFRYPLLSYSFAVYRIFVFFLGKSKRDVNRIAKKFQLPLIKIDAEPDQAVKCFKRWYNLPAMLLLILFLWITSGHFHYKSLFSLLFTLVLILITVAVAYVLLFGINTVDCRNAAFAKHTARILSKRKYKKIILICGRDHVKGVKELLMRKYNVILLD